MGTLEKCCLARVAHAVQLARFREFDWGPRKGRAAAYDKEDREGFRRWLITERAEFGMLDEFHTPTVHESCRKIEQGFHALRDVEADGLRRCRI